MFKFFLVTSFLGTAANLVQAPWNFFFLIFIIFPIIHIILDKIIRDQKYRNRFISIFILLGGFLYFYFLFGFSWIIHAFEFKPELSSFKYITLFGLPFLMLIFTCPSFIIPTILWDERLSTVGAFNLSSQLDVNISKRTKNIDKNAATFILQGAIDYLNN